MALGQWLASTPKRIVADTLKLNDSTIDQMKSDKQIVVAAKANK